MRRTLLVALAGIIVEVATGCPQKSAVWIEDGSTSQHLVFRLGRSVGGGPPDDFYGMTVSRCGADGTAQNAVWAVARSQDVPVPIRVVYGEAPAGYRTVKGPDPLQPGCYEAADSGSGRMRFLVNVDGSVQVQKDE